MKHYLTALLVIGTIFWSGCDPTLDETRVEPAPLPEQRTPAESADNAVAKNNNVRGGIETVQKEAALAGVEQTISQLDARMEQLSNTAEQGVADGKPELQTALTDLREQRVELDALVRRMREASGNAWQEVQEEFRLAYQEFLNTLEETEGKLRG